MIVKEFRPNRTEILHDHEALAVHPPPRPLYDVRGGDAGAAISGHNQVSLGSVAASTFPGRDYG